MWWLWFVGPIAVVVVYVLTGLSKAADEKRLREASAWRNGPGGGAKLVKRLTPELTAALEEAGAGQPLAIYELFPKIAYLAVMTTDAIAASDHQTVVGKLEGPPLSFTARPLPILDGKRIPNTGVRFPKDPEFMAEILVEGADLAAIKKWLSRPLRSALLDMPEAWLRVSGKIMTLTLFGAADEDRLDELVVVADTIFAEHGAEGGPSLLGDDEAAERGAKDEVDEGEGEGEGEPPASKKAAPAKVAPAKKPVAAKAPSKDASIPKKTAPRPGDKSKGSAK